MFEAAALNQYMMGATLAAVPTVSLPENICISFGNVTFSGAFITLKNGNKKKKTAV